MTLQSVYICNGNDRQCFELSRFGLTMVLLTFSLSCLASYICIQILRLLLYQQLFTLYIRSFIQIKRIDHVAPVVGTHHGVSEAYQQQPLLRLFLERHLLQRDTRL